MKKKLLIVAVVATMVLVMCGCSEETEMVGHWTIKEITAGDIVMTEDDINDMGLESGFLELKKSGNVELEVLGDVYEGTWVRNEDGTATVTYFNEDNPDPVEGTATKEESGITFKDAQGSLYKLERF